MQPHKIVSREEWIEARKAHLAHEKEFTRARDRLSAERRALPWVKVDKAYAFDGPDGKADAGRSVRRAQPARRAAFHVRARLGRRLQELLVLGRRLRAHDPASGRARHHPGRGLARAARKSSKRSSSGWAGRSTGYRRPAATSTTTSRCRSRRTRSRPARHGYNFGTSGFGIEDAPGISVFYRDEAGDIFHTYSCFARGLDMMNAAYHYLDLTPLGRHEEGLPYPMDWLRLRDQYQPAPAQASCCHS